MGSPDYHERTRKEAAVFTRQLVRQFGEPPPGCRFKLRANPHDFGTYHDLEIVFDDADEVAVDYAFKVEGGTPEYWDEIARSELGRAGAGPLEIAA